MTTRSGRQVVVLLALALGGPPGALAQGHTGHGAPAPSSPLPAADGGVAATASERPGQVPEGYAEVQLVPERQQLIGLKLARAERATLTGTVRATALVQADETREAHVHSKLMGWVQEVHVGAVGQRVKKGEPLYTLYSQELYATQAEYLRARSTSRDLAAAARERLRLWDVPEDEVRRIERRGPQRTVTFRAPRAGTVIEKGILAGHYVGPEVLLYRIADLTQVWVVAQVYEYEVERLDPVGQAQVHVQGLPGSRSARVDYIYPTVDVTSRTVKVRLVLPNADGRLRPGAFATVELPTRATDALWVPDEAVVDTGTRQVVYVALEGGRFRPTLVALGRRAGGRTEVRAGLEAGQQVVVSAQFLLDSESRLRGVEKPAAHGGH